MIEINVTDRLSNCTISIIFLQPKKWFMVSTSKVKGSHWWIRKHTFVSYFKFYSRHTSFKFSSLNEKKVKIPQHHCYSLTNNTHILCYRLTKQLNFFVEQLCCNCDNKVLTITWLNAWVNRRFFFPCLHRHFMNELGHTETQ